MAAAAGSRREVSRRDLLIETALDVIAEHGVTGTTHRRIAAAASVPLGSTTYYFADLGDLFRAAFGRLADHISERFEARLEPARSPDDAMDAIVDYLRYDLGDHREAALSYEFYAYAIRHPEVRSMVEAWFERSQRALQRFFDPVTAKLLDSMIEGLSTYHGLVDQTRDPSEIRLALERLTALDTRR
jgi:TetR/AcrR family transcriptional regulator, regulator of biofilm formation and stress response